MNSNSKIIATALYFAWANGDIEKFLHFFDDDILYQRHKPAREDSEAGSSPANCRGKKGILDRMEQFRRKYELIDLEIISMVAEDARVASRCIVEKRDRATGRVIKSEFCHFWTIRDDKVSTLMEFGSSTHQVEAERVMPILTETNVIQFSAALAKR